MVSKIDFKNYKAFKKGSIELKPITILLGANSVGKSSIMQLILLMTQTLNNPKNNLSLLSMNGDIIRLGEFENIIHNKLLSNNLELSFTLDDFSIRHLRNRISNKLNDMAYSLERTLAYLTTNVLEDNSNLRLRRYSARDENIDHLITKIEGLKGILNDKFISMPVEKVERMIQNSFPSFRFRRLSYYYDKDRNRISVDLNDYKNALQFLKSIESKVTKKPTITFRFYLKHGVLAVEKISITHRKNTIISYELVTKKGKRHPILYSNFYDSNYLKKYGKLFHDSVIFKIDELEIRNEFEDRTNMFFDSIISVFNECLESLQRSFSIDDINYVGPLRSFPRRYYFLNEDKQLNILNIINGNQLAEILKDKPEIRKKVNNWLSTFELKVNINQLKDDIHNIVVNQNGLSLNITDVGFGVSQVLPIIVQGFLSDSDSLTLIEQPEIHLHPKMQAELADLFIDIVNDESEEGRKLLIETHSEYLLKRLRRRMAEGKIDPKNVAIYLFNPKKTKSGSATIKKLAINRTGNFDWPHDFYADDLKDTIEFLKHQK